MILSYLLKCLMKRILIWEKYAYLVLEYDGLCVLLDVITKDKEGNQYLPVIKNIQLNSLLKEADEFRTLLPLSCYKYTVRCTKECFTQQKISVPHTRKRNDLSKVTYRIIGRKAFVSKLFKNMIILCVCYNEIKMKFHLSVPYPKEKKWKMLTPYKNNTLSLCQETKRKENFKSQYYHKYVDNMAKRSFFVKDSELDDFQVQILNKRTDKSFIVKGCAGSGKSILALWKAKQIQEEKKGSFIFIVFTKALMEYMSSGIQQIGLNSENVDYFWNWERRGCPSADYIIIDEAQDFSKEDILRFKEKANKALLLYGDSAQQLYKFIKDKNTISMEEMTHCTGFTDEPLIFNHRLPKKVARVAEYIIDGFDMLERKCKNEGTEKPKILEYSSFKAQLNAIAEIIKNRNFEDVGILFRYNADVERAYNYFTESGILNNVEAKFGQKMVLNFNTSNPKILTYHSSKGLQFEAVFLPECNITDQTDNNPLYVAVTRTYQSLYIMHSGNLSPLFDSVPANLYETSLVSGQTIRL